MRLEALRTIDPKDGIALLHDAPPLAFAAVLIGYAVGTSYRKNEYQFSPGNPFTQTHPDRLATLEERIGTIGTGANFRYLVSDCDERI